MKRSRLALPVAVAAILSMLGCAPTSSPPADTEGWVVPEVADDPPPVDPALVLPAESYRLSDEQRAIMGEAQERLLEACALEFGVEMQFIGNYVRKPDNPTYYWGGLWGTMTEDHAQEYGYLATPTGPWKTSSGFTTHPPDIFYAYTSQEVDPRNDLLQAVAQGPEIQELVPREDRIELPRDGNGAEIPPGGCVAIVEREIGAPFDSSIDDDLFSLKMLALAQNRVARAESEWVTCMKRATGEDFPTVSEAWPNGGRPETAVADVRCTQESRWPDFFYPVYEDYERQMIAKEPERFEAALAAEQERFEVLTRGSANG